MLTFAPAILLTLSALVGQTSANCAHGTSISPLNYISTSPAQVAVSAFSYDALTGPLNWFGLNATANKMCAEGQNQSPIIIDSSVTMMNASEMAMNFSVPDVDSATFENLGTNVEVIKNGTLTVNGTVYSLAQFHFHLPSEHRINDEVFMMEMHYVFESADKQYAVVAFMIDVPDSGYTSPLLEQLFVSIGNISSPGNVTTTGPLSFDSLTTHFYEYPLYTYTGSLTTPPCSESVAWYISSHPLWISLGMFNNVKKVLKFNARYTQDTLGQTNLLTEAGEELKNASALMK